MEDEIYQEFKAKFSTAVKKIFPELGVYFTGSIDNGFSFSLTGYNVNWKGSNYYYKDNAELIHFTSLPILYSILREKELRLYCLENSDDPNEFRYAADELNVPSEMFRLFKDNKFSLSLCHPDTIDNLDLWRFFGLNGEGIAIKFRFGNYDKWDNFYLSKVYYDKPKIFEELLKIKDEINASGEYHADVDLSDFLCLHKSALFRNEHEYRLLYNGKNDGEHHDGRKEQTTLDVNRRNEIVQFYKLPLLKKDLGNYVKNNNDFLVSKPHIIITEIYLGHKLGEIFEEQSKQIRALCRKWLGWHDLEVKESPLKDSFK